MGVQNCCSESSEYNYVEPSELSGGDTRFLLCTKNTTAGKWWVTWVSR